MIIYNKNSAFVLSVLYIYTGFVMKWKSVRRASESRKSESKAWVEVFFIEFFVLVSTSWGQREGGMSKWIQVDVAYWTHSGSAQTFSTAECFLLSRCHYFEFLFRSDHWNRVFWRLKLQLSKTRKPAARISFWYRLPIQSLSHTHAHETFRWMSKWIQRQLWRPSSHRRLHWQHGPHWISYRHCRRRRPSFHSMNR